MTTLLVCLLFIVRYVEKSHRYTHGAHHSTLVILVDFGITAKVPFHLRQGEATIGKAHVVNDDLGLLKEGHLDHVLNRRAQDDHFEAFPLRDARDRLRSGVQSRRKRRRGFGGGGGD